MIKNSFCLFFSCVKFHFFFFGFDPKTIFPPRLTTIYVWTVLSLYLKLTLLRFKFFFCFLFVSFLVCDIICTYVNGERCVRRRSSCGRFSLDEFNLLFIYRRRLRHRRWIYASIDMRLVWVAEIRNETNKWAAPNNGRKTIINFDEDTRKKKTNERTR